MKRRKRERGSIMLESLFGMCFLLFLGFALVELFVMIGRQMAADYASFYGAKALALGYAGENCRKAVRVAGIPASGRDISSDDSRVAMAPSSAWVRESLRTQAARYMQLGRPSGVEYQYWYNEGEDTRFVFSMNLKDERVNCNVRLRKPEFLMEPMGKLMSISAADGTNSAEPEGESQMYNYAHQWMLE